MALVNFKNEVLVRVYAVTAVVTLIALVIFLKAFKLVTQEGERWRKEADKSQLRNREMPGERGNILAEDGALLATSIPYFETRMDFGASGLGQEEFAKGMDSLAWYLANYLTPQANNYDQWREFLWQHHNAKSRYVMIAKDLTADQLAAMKTFPIFKDGPVNGFITVPANRREHPFKMLALRTLGYTKEDLKIGLEGRFDKELSGGKETVPMILINKSKDQWIPLQDLTDIEPKSGDDIVTTLDINTQDITQSALIRTCELHQAEHACAIVMEVKTGKIKAISNISKTKDGWWEDYNYAVGTAIEPGSTIKLASMLALLEEKAVRLSDTVDIENGRKDYYGEILEDHERTAKRLITVKEAFAASSNVGISKLVFNHFNDKRGAYIQHLRDFNLNIPTGVELDGEAPPYIKHPDNANDQWSGTTLPWMSVGYELSITPLQLLTFYNAVANNGQMMKPYFVSEIRRYGTTTQTFKPQVIKQKIASDESLSQARELLESVIELPMGTAHHWRTPQYRFAGKTGTAQLNYSKDKSKTHKGGYQGAFAGYFPAENPIYSCIVIVSKPKTGFYGGIVAAPVFREIADKMMASNVALSEPMNDKGKPVPSPALLPDDVGFKPDMLKMLQNVGLKYEIFGQKEDEWVFLRAKSDTLNVVPRQLTNKKVVPSVVGMGLKDALYLLENRGLRVSFSGYGKVATQSLTPGMVVGGQTISIRLD
jgi:cell division protein FtsI (penicillin-binding protein 3)